MSQTPTPVHESVREHYAELARQNSSCCGPSGAPLTKKRASRIMQTSLQNKLVCEKDFP
jgi:hypothetical protein